MSLTKRGTSNSAPCSCWFLGPFMCFFFPEGIKLGYRLFRRPLVHISMECVLSFSRRNCSWSPCLRCLTPTSWPWSWTEMWSKARASPDTAGESSLRAGWTMETINTRVPQTDLHVLHALQHFVKHDMHVCVFASQGTSEGLCRGGVRLRHRGGELAPAGRRCQQLSPPSPNLIWLPSTAIGGNHLQLGFDISIAGLFVCVCVWVGKLNWQRKLLTHGGVVSLWARLWERNNPLVLCVNFFILFFG